MGKEKCKRERKDLIWSHSEEHQNGKLKSVKKSLMGSHGDLYETEEASKKIGYDCCLWRQGIERRSGLRPQQRLSRVGVEENLF